MGHPILGPAYLGQKEYERQVKESKQTGGGVLGPAFTDDPNLNRSAATPRFKVAGDVSSLSVKDLKAAIELDAGLVSDLFAAELERPDGARRSALQALAYAERSKAEPDEALLEAIRTGVPAPSAPPSAPPDPGEDDGALEEPRDDEELEEE